MTEDEGQQAQEVDAAEHLRTPASRAEYLNIVLADGDPAEVRDALNLVARAQGVSQVAKAAGVTREGL
jgi:probable addiction module antidote protein